LRDIIRPTLCLGAHDEDASVSVISPIDRSSFEPAYAQVARLLRDRIATGEYRSGDRLPSEAELCDTYQVSPMTVRRAVTQLVREGVATTEQGRGTFVKAPELSAATFDLRDLSRYLEDPGIEVRILEARIVSPTQRVGDKLAVGAEARVIGIKRLLTRDEQPIFYHSEYLVFDPARPLVEAELGVTSLQGLFAGSGGSTLKYGRLTLHASALTPSEAAHLGEDAGTLAWVVEHLFFDFSDRPESWGRFICRADRLSFSTTVGVVHSTGGRGKGHRDERRA
jgi:GntR family transcriptional regulator